MTRAFAFMLVLVLGLPGVGFAASKGAQDRDPAASPPSFDLKAVREGEAVVPAVFLETLPPELPEIRETAKRKRMFLRTVLPLVLESNRRIMTDRAELLALAAKRRLLPRDISWLKSRAQYYEVATDTPDLFDALLYRIDAIPPSLAIAQSITESGWGTSRFARRGRALFGQRTWSRGAGLVPERRRDGETYEVRAFDNLLQSVESYMRNLNTHPAYAELRAMRAVAREEGEPVLGADLVTGLERYAETGPQYVEDLQAIMRVNRLAEFEQAQLSGAAARVASR